MSENLIAYIPTLNQRHLNWFFSHRGSDLFLVTQPMAEKILPRLKRNMASLPTEMVAEMIESKHLLRKVWFFDAWDPPEFRSPTWNNWILPDEDVSHLLADEYLLPAGCSVRFEPIWARWDMQAVLAEQPVISDLEISLEEFDRKILQEAAELSRHSPDWWRQVGATLLDRNGKVLARAYNTHMPNEYETYIFGDPAINRDAGQKGKSCARHAEVGVIAECAKHGLAVEGGSIYVTTFPCESCAAMIVDSGIREVYFSEGYSSLNSLDIFRSRNVKLIQVKNPDA